MLYRRRALVKREFGRLKNEWPLSLIPLDVNDQFVADLLLAESIARHLRLDDYPLLFQDEVDSRSGAGPLWRVVLWPDIVEEQAQQSVEDVLKAVLVGHDDRRLAAPSVAEGHQKLREVPANPLDQEEILTSLTGAFELLARFRQDLALIQQRAPEASVERT